MDVGGRHEHVAIFQVDLADSTAIGTAANLPIWYALGTPEATRFTAVSRPFFTRTKDLHEPDFFFVCYRQGHPGVGSAVVLKSVLLYHGADYSNGLACGSGPHQTVGYQRGRPVVAVGAGDTARTRQAGAHG